MPDDVQRTAEWVHRTALNTIRYLLTTSVIDRDAIAYFTDAPPAGVNVGPGLSAVLAEGANQVGQIASGVELDDEFRRRFRILESRLRVHMLVDPDTDGAFAVWGMETVEGLAARGCITEVKGISSSADQRPVPGVVRSIIDRILVLPLDSASIRVLTDGVDDYLSLMLRVRDSFDATAEWLRSAGLPDGGSRVLDACIVDGGIESDSGDAVITLVITRHIDLTD